MNQNFFDHHLNELKEKYEKFDKLEDYHVFILLCMKYYYFSNSNAHFDEDEMLECLTDGKNDGGIDAIFNDPTSENNDVIILQSKYYLKTKLEVENVAGELYKINDTLEKLKLNKVEDINDKTVSAYRNATSQMEDNGEIRVVFFSSYQPTNKRERNKLDKMIKKHFNNLDVEINFRSDIEAQIEMCDNGKAYVDYDSLVIDDKNNVLKYEDSIIVNISALSLQDLHIRRRNGLLGMNLIYYIKQNVVDKGIDDTIKLEPENFWYKNNGIVIICDDFELDGTVVKMHNFSIINGGQTTNRLGRIDIESDFYLQCKIIKKKGTEKISGDDFALNIAKSTNSQKAIKKSDLKANTIEQIRLKERLNKYNVYYITKKGDKIPKNYDLPYQSVYLETVGKLSLAGVLQMPGSARSNSQRMYNDEYYHSIFGSQAKAGIIADLLKISYYYDQFKKHELKDKGYSENETIPMFKNGSTFIYASISLLCKIINNVIDYNADISSYVNNVDDLKVRLRKNGDLERIINNNFQDEKEIFYQIFSIIGDEVLGYCYGNAIEKAKDKQESLAPSNYLKLDTNYYNFVIPRLWRIYSSNTKLKESIDKICKK